MKILPTRFPRYSVSDTGKVFHDGKEIAAHPRGNLTKVNDSRYMAVNISIYDENGKFAKQTKHYVHRLVAEAFIPNPENLSDVDHIDCVKSNNHVSNLRWSSRDDNMARNRLPNGTIRKRKSYYIMEDGNWILIPKSEYDKHGITHETKKTSN